MDKAAELKQEILQKTAEYYQLRHAPGKDDFMPGETRVNYAGRVFDAEELANLVSASLDFWLTAGEWTRKFEQGLAACLQVPYALMVNSGSSANLLAFAALTSPLLGERAIRRGDEVITVACAFPTTVAPIIQFGAVPVFVDVDAETANIDVSKLAAAATNRTRAVMLAHTLGNPFDLKSVVDFCRSRGLWLIEDNCDALGSQFNGKFTGTFGDIGTSSFYPPHHLTTGEGGAVYTSNPLLHKILRSMRDWGRDCWCDSGRDNSCHCRFSGQFGELPFGYDHKYVYSHFGFNLKATDMQAAIGCAQLKKLPDFTARRIANHDFLISRLDRVPALKCQQALPACRPSWFGLLLTVATDAPFTRNDLTAFLEKNQIQTRNLFAGNLVRHPCFSAMRAGVDYRISGTLTNTDNIMNNSFWIGVYPGMTAAKLNYMADRIIEFCSR